MKDCHKLMSYFAKLLAERQVRFVILYMLAVQAKAPTKVVHAQSEASMEKSRVAALLAVSVVITLSGCFPGGSSYSTQEPAGFFSGVWHGWIAPLSLIVGLFKDDIRIYEPFNTGWWYDFGFYIAVIAGFGGIALSRKRKKRDDGS